MTASQLRALAQRRIKPPVPRRHLTPGPIVGLHPNPKRRMRQSEHVMQEAMSRAIAQIFDESPMGV